MSSEFSRVVEEAQRVFIPLRNEVQKMIVGQNYLIDRLLIALLMDGHILLEGLPGLAKTLTISTLAKALSCDFKRIQFTPDLLPADLIGTSIYNPKEGSFSVKKGPLFTQIVVADELNRAPAKVQSALLEAMAERQITIQGETFKLAAPFLVLATQNPIDQEGTYPLSEAQLDRFMMKIEIKYPAREEEKEIIRRYESGIAKKSVEKILEVRHLLEARAVAEKIYVDDKVVNYVLDIVTATRQDVNAIKLSHFIESGVSPRATLALIAAAKGHAFFSKRGYVTPHDVKAVAHDILRHRISLSHEAIVEGFSKDLLIDRLLNSIVSP